MNDRSTKLILIFIALALWANVAATMMQPTPDSVTYFPSYLERMAIALDDMADGKCKNRKFC